MVRLLRRSIAGGGIALFALLLLLPVSAQASTSKIDSTTSAHLARALASAPRGVTHWSITVSQMTATHFTGSAGRFGAGFLTNTVYGSCGSSWMALGNLGRGHAWVSLGWDINKPAYWEAWSTTVVGWATTNYNSGSGAIPPWNSESWDTGYNAYLGVGPAVGYPYMQTWNYGSSGCVSNGPSASVYVTN